MQKFLHMPPPQVSYHHLPDRGELLINPKKRFLKIYILSTERGGVCAMKSIIVILGLKKHFYKMFAKTRSKRFLKTDFSKRLRKRKMIPIFYGQ